MIGVNLSGAEFGGTGTRYGFDYIYPSAVDIQYYANRGVELVRLPVTWERLQPTANGDLDPAELGRLRDFLSDADAAGVKVIVDLHNFGYYRGAQLGTSALPDSQFAGFWQKLAAAIGNAPALAGYDLMNEPHDLPDAHAWPDAAQAAVLAIRSVDLVHSIYVEGEGYAYSGNWSANNPNLDIFDPLGKIVYEAHLYFDRYSSGTYTGSYDAEGATPDVGAARLTDFVQWLDDRGARGIIGETGVPDNDPRWLTLFDNYLTAVNAAGLDTLVWGGGPWWGDYALALRHADGSASAQLAVIDQHVAAESAGSGGEGGLLGSPLGVVKGVGMAMHAQAMPMDGIDLSGWTQPFAGADTHNPPMAAAATTFAPMVTTNTLVAASSAMAALPEPGPIFVQAAAPFVLSPVTGMGDNLDERDEAHAFLADHAMRIDMNHWIFA